MPQDQPRRRWKKGVFKRATTTSTTTTSTTTTSTTTTSTTTTKPEGMDPIAIRALLAHYAILEREKAKQLKKDEKRAEKQILEDGKRMQLQDRYWCCQ